MLVSRGTGIEIAVKHFEHGWVPIQEQFDPVWERTYGPHPEKPAYYEARYNIPDDTEYVYIQENNFRRCFSVTCSDGRTGMVLYENCQSFEITEVMKVFNNSVKPDGLLDVIRLLEIAARSHSRAKVFGAISEALELLGVPEEEFCKEYAEGSSKAPDWAWGATKLISVLRGRDT